MSVQDQGPIISYPFLLDDQWGEPQNRHVSIRFAFGVFCSLTNASLGAPAHFMAGRAGRNPATGATTKGCGATSKGGLAI